MQARREGPGPATIRFWKGIRMACGQDGVETSRTAEIPPTPRNVDISITGVCNLRCKYCYYSEDMKRAADLPGTVWQSFFLELAECRVLTLTLLGGEPFARADFADLVESIVANRMRFSVLTNGTLVDRRSARMLASTSRVDYVQVSIDGDEATHDGLRGRGTWRRAVAGIEALLAEGVPATVRITITKQGSRCLYETCRFVLGLGVKRLGVNEVFPRGRACDNRSALLLGPGDKLEAMRQMERFVTEHPGTVSDQGGGPLWKLKFKDAVEKHLLEGRPLPFKTGYLSACRCAFSKVDVLHDGTYVPCNQLSGMAMGNIRTHRLRDVWLNHPVLRDLRSRIDVPLSEVPGCRSCSSQKFCTGGCPGMVEGIEKDVRQPNRLECFTGLKPILDAFDFRRS